MYNVFHVMDIESYELKLTNSSLSIVKFANIQWIKTYLSLFLQKISACCVFHPNTRPISICS